MFRIDGAQAETDIFDATHTLLRRIRQMFSEFPHLPRQLIRIRHVDRLDRGRPFLKRFLHGREHPVTLALKQILEIPQLGFQLEPQRLDVLVSLLDDVVGVLGEQLLPLLILTANPNPLLTLC